jgi:hypothetical protein
VAGPSTLNTFVTFVVTSHQSRRRCRHPSLRQALKLEARCLSAQSKCSSGMKGGRTKCGWGGRGGEGFSAIPRAFALRTCVSGDSSSRPGRSQAMHLLAYALPPTPRPRTSIRTPRRNTNVLLAAAEKAPEPLSLQIVMSAPASCFVGCQQGSPRNLLTGCSQKGERVPVFCTSPGSTASCRVLTVPEGRARGKGKAEAFAQATFTRHRGMSNHPTCKHSPPGQRPVVNSSRIFASLCAVGSHTQASVYGSSPRHETLQTSAGPRWRRRRRGGAGEERGKRRKGQRVWGGCCGVLGVLRCLGLRSRV